MGGAVAAAEELPDPLGAELLDAAREAFTQALQLTAITSAAIVVGVAILTAVVLRDVQRAPGPRGSRSRAALSRAARYLVPPPRGSGATRRKARDSVSEEPAG